MYLIFDTETTGLPKKYNAPLSDAENWPRMVQIAWQLHDDKGTLLDAQNHIVKPEGYEIPYNAEKIHGISTERALKQGKSLEEVLLIFADAVDKAKFIAGHNIEFDNCIVGAEFLRCGMDNLLEFAKSIDTKNTSTDFCAIPGGKGGGYKWPTLSELHQKLFGKGFGDAHNAAADVEATARCFLELIRLGIVGPKETGLEASYFKEFKLANPEPIEPAGIEIDAYVTSDLEDPEETIDEVEFIEEEKEDEVEIIDEEQKHIIEEVLADEKPFTHLHCHTHFSILQATCEISHLLSTARQHGMKALAITDKGNMYGAFKFHKEATLLGIKPIIGCEFFLCENHDDKTRKDNGFAQVVLAKNKKGYRNLCKLNAVAFIDGFYYVPRIDKNVLLEYKSDLIILSSGMRGEINHLLLNNGEKEAEASLIWWKEQFGDDFYLELVRHGLQEEQIANDFLLKMSKKHNIKVIAANNVFYVEQADSNAHDILMCVKDGELQKTPIGKGRGFRFGFPNDEYYFKSSSEMKIEFADLPQAITNLDEIVDKIEEYELKRDVLLPAFIIPENFDSENDYLRHLTYEGAAERYDELTDDIRTRLDFELETIKKTGYPGYFLIVQDITSEARKMGVSVGPGRGSAAGSAVAYCIGITNVDPIKYDLLFERFLNPDRVSLPDIDIDFDDEGRSRVIDFVVNKYGKSQVAQIITYGSMAAKSAIRDTARVLDLNLSEADHIAKLVPSISLQKLSSLSEKELKSKLSGDEFENGLKLKKLFDGKDLTGETLRQASILEGSLRNTGTHACGLIITPEDMTELIPVASAKDAELMVTQYDNSVIESAGMLKMDFLGLKTLTIIKDAIEIIKKRHGVEIEVDEIPLDDKKTFELYQRGETNGTFQFESAGMQKHLKALKPDKFADLIAMNALFRPGPMEYIPNFIKRKQGEEPIVYDCPEMEEFLAETYGITVYQEQVMLLSQKLAGFSKGDADVLRKAMGKKIAKLLEELKPKFIKGCEDNGIKIEVAEKIWKDWQAFAMYAFNKSHSTCYSVIAFQTAYLKANYTAEYMAAVLTNNMNDIKKVSFFMEECKRIGLKVLGPDINESLRKFTVNKNGEIRFGLGAIKGVGEAAVDNIVENRIAEEPFLSIFDLTKRIDLRSVNKRTLESLAQAGAFDGFRNTHRAQYFAADESGRTGIELAVKFANGLKNQQDQAQMDIFGESAEEVIVDPTLPECDPWNQIDLLTKEKQLVGIYISGHPLDDFRLEIKNFCTTQITALKQLEPLKDRELKFAGTVIESAHRLTKKGKPFGILALEDYLDSHRFMLFSDDYVKFKDYLVVGWHLFVQGRVVSHPYRPGELEFKISRMELLSDLRDKMAQSITLNVPQAFVNEDFVERMAALSKTHAGKCQLILNLIDGKKKESLRLVSRSQRVNITDEFLSEISEFKEINYVIN